MSRAEVLVRSAEYPVPERLVEEILDRCAPPLAGRIVFNALHRSRLRVNVRKCRRCSACAAACPVGAMEVRDGEYAIDARRCLH